MTQKRWLRIIPVALIMYTISYIDRTNVSLALDPKISSMMHELFMDDEMKGRLAGCKFPADIWRRAGARESSSVSV
jgi:hypothetical protein